MTPVTHLKNVCREIKALGLLGEPDCRFIDQIEAIDVAMSRYLSDAESVHLHIKVAEVAGLPRKSLEGLGWAFLLERTGFVVAGAGKGVSVSFSSVPVTSAAGVARTPPYLDHIGIDITEGADPAAQLEAIHDWAKGLGWEVEHQGGSDGPVRCCYASVAQKLWVFPPVGADGVDVAIEFSYGEAEEATEEMGTDLRPVRRGSLVGSQCCCGGSEKGERVVSIGASARSPKK